MRPVVCLCVLCLASCSPTLNSKGEKPESNYDRLGSIDRKLDEIIQVEKSRLNLEKQYVDRLDEILDRLQKEKSK